jgi:hypothetical protein
LPSIADRLKSLASFLVASTGDASSVMEGEHEERVMTEALRERIEEA